MCMLLLIPVRLYLGILSSAKSQFCSYISLRKVTASDFCRSMKLQSNMLSSLSITLPDDDRAGSWSAVSVDEERGVVAVVDVGTFVDFLLFSSGVVVVGTVVAVEDGFPVRQSVYVLCHSHIQWNSEVIKSLRGLGDPGPRQKLVRRSSKKFKMK